MTRKFMIRDGPLDASLLEFIDRFIHSIEEMEILCLLGETPKKSWSVAEVFRVVRSSEASVAARLQYFVEAGFLSPDGDGLYRYEPQKPEFAKAVSAMGTAYRYHRVSVIEAIYRKQPNPGWNTSV